MSSDEGFDLSIIRIFVILINSFLARLNLPAGLHTLPIKTKLSPFTFAVNSKLIINERSDPDPTRDGSE